MFDYERYERLKMLENWLFEKSYDDDMEKRRKKWLMESEKGKDRIRRIELML